MNLSNENRRIRQGVQKFSINVDLQQLRWHPLPLWTTRFLSVQRTAIWFGPFTSFAMAMRIQGRHGTLPDRFVGLWVRDTKIEFDTLGQAFYLMPDGRFAGMPGMTVRRWHFDGNTFFVDSVSRCGNCYQGNVTSEASATFSDPDHMILVSRDKGQTKGFVGHYRRIQITKELKDLMAKQSESEDDEISFRARMVKKVIEHQEALSLRS